ncbi:hypothetical protein [Chromobacterium haemolyticum]|uniref:DUF4398 domain-containing protein n=1 Tax=Chromobacterium haemolyticum TaxID=394935 RepID=A0ABS3GNN5_9NEIS|nr:hypothetical protein [Chromobacterium haemolyticum]MBK0414818.1 hypothetical protein [Chromobacterium haemolyticum]MBO0416197.1 hypothetical protein [Chromobacterium haemolyticum]MBO0499304.1 hypothetical protein [Chromobacterium haemolyticum]MDH0342632.1 hypothetical protein [Chromobacterium haemolyticum]PTU72103.1 hypothetical protein DBB33_22995 [Chromobacterium haemolyticum]
MKVNGIVAVLAALALPALVLAQTADEQLLAAQMYYQQVRGTQQKADARLAQAESDKVKAEQRLAEAQAGLSGANAELEAAKSAQAAAAQISEAATKALNEAWQRKDSGQ